MDPALKTVQEVLISMECEMRHAHINRVLAVISDAEEMFSGQEQHSGQIPATTIYRSCGPLEQLFDLCPSTEVLKKWAPGSIHDV